MEQSLFWMDKPPDFIHLFFFRQFGRHLKMDYPSQTVKCENGQWPKPIRLRPARRTLQKSRRNLRS